MKQLKRTIPMALGAVLAFPILLARPAAAELCTDDRVPAATLLLPYFEVNLQRKRSNTEFSIANASAAPTIAHVTLWTDWGVPTLAFDVFLTGYDVERINLRKLFSGGALPQSAHAQNDPADELSSNGGNPSWDSEVDPGVSPTRFVGCDGALPPAPLDDSALDRLRNAHTGRETGSGCVAFNHGDNIARGYVTIDNVLDCTLLFPGDPDYFDGLRVVSDTNQLWGESSITQNGEGMATAPLVAIEASEGFFADGEYTFYGRYVDGSAVDAREPLGTTWATRTTNSKLRFGESKEPVSDELVIWRDTTSSLTRTSYECGSEVPAWFPFNETQIVAFDDQEQAIELCGFAESVDPTCAPLATQRIDSNGGDLSYPFKRGWIYWNLNTTVLGNPFGSLAQSYVSTLRSVENKLRGSIPSALLSSACADE